MVWCSGLEIPTTHTTTGQYTASASCYLCFSFAGTRFGVVFLKQKDSFHVWCPLFSDTPISGWGQVAWLRLWKQFCDVFNCMPVCAIIDEKIICMHGCLANVGQAVFATQANPQLSHKENPGRWRLGRDDSPAPTVNGCSCLCISLRGSG